MSDADSYISPQEAQQILNISSPTFYRLLARKKLSAIKIGRSTRIRRSEIDRFVNSCPSLVARTGLKG
jgi:excisionase family DNA binding protein